MKHVLFLDGIGCNPDGFKPRFLQGLGYRVTAPLLPDRDFAAAVAISDEAVARSTPDIIVGYSRGAGVALMLADRRIPRLLIAPSLRWVSDGRGFDGPIIIVHSSTDDGLPVADVRGHLQRCKLNAELRIVGADHTMIDTDALNAITVALDELIVTASYHPR
ncbi:MAG: alpha/beta hydrolase [Planctomycetia bacterium]|nr:alpha/beta hydrolase [Planctomycetia bacterium]